MPPIPRTARRITLPINTRTPMLVSACPCKTFTATWPSVLVISVFTPTQSPLVNGDGSSCGRNHSLMTLRGARERAVASVQWEVRRLPIRAPLHDLLTPGRKIKPSSDKSPSKGPMMVAIVNFVRTSQAAICTNTDGLTSLGEAGVADREMEDMIAFNSLTDTGYSPTTTVLDSGLSV
jgi:hypothetical protein